MRSGLLGLMLLIMAALVASPASLAQTPAGSGTARTPTVGHGADLSGIWLAARDEPSFRFTLEDPPLTPWAMEIYRRNRQGLRDPREQGLDELDPYTYCFPMGPTRLMLGRFFHFEIVPLPSQNMLIFEVSNGVCVVERFAEND